MATAVATDRDAPAALPGARCVQGNVGHVYAAARSRKRSKRELASRPDSSACCGCLGWANCPSRSAAIPAEHGQLVYTVRSVGQATHALVNQQRRRLASACEVRSARAGRCEAARGRDVIIVAGGIGLAPLRPVIYHVLQQPRRLRPSGDSLWSAQPARSALSQRTGRLGAPAGHPGAGHGGLRRASAGAGTWAWSPRCSSTRGLQPSALGRDDLRAGDHDALRDSRTGNARTAAATTSISRWNAT